jgi:hypothetical protein
MDLLGDRTDGATEDHGSDSHLNMNHETNFYDMIDDGDHNLFTVDAMIFPLPRRIWL